MDTFPLRNVPIVDSLTLMDQTREKLHCSVCGWDWWKRLGAPDPKRCARPTCRSMRWKGANPEGPAGDHPDELDAVPEGCSSVEGAGDPEPAEARRYVPFEE